MPKCLDILLILWLIKELSAFFDHNAQAFVRRNLAKDLINADINARCQGDCDSSADRRKARTASKKIDVL